LYAQADTLRDVSSEWAAVREQAAVVCEEALRANRLCESLLDLAQVRSSSSILRREWVTLEEIIGAALRSLAGVPGSATVDLELPPDLPWLQLDVRMFERVVANLVDNALKQGGAHQRVCIAADCDAQRVHLRVSNSGSRFPEHAEHLLSAFARGERHDGNAGFGIGLATCQAVVLAHGGSLTLRNRDAAAEVEIRLPLPKDTMPTLPNALDSAGSCDE
jgi:two-component system sensor histidine kinase KdpD